MNKEYVKIDPYYNYSLKAFSKDGDIPIFEGDKKKADAGCDKRFTIDYKFPSKFSVRDGTRIETPAEFIAHVRSRKMWYLSRQSPLLFDPPEDRSWNNMYFPFLHCTRLEDRSYRVD